MKLHFSLLFFLSSMTFCFAQHGENPLPFVPQEPKYDTAPHFPGGSNAMMKYLNDSIRYPEPEKTKRLHGSVHLKFDVTEKGDIENIKLLNGVSGGPNLAR